MSPESRSRPDSSRQDDLDAVLGSDPALPAAWLRALYDSPQLLCWLLRADGVVLAANDRAVGGRGLDRTEVLGRPLWHRGWSADGGQAQLRRSCERVAGTGVTARERVTHVLGDGTERPLDLALSPVSDRQGRVTHLAAVGCETTAGPLGTGEAEARLARTLQLTGKVLDHVGEGIYGLDRQGRAEFVNAALCRLTGYRREELLGRDLHELLHGWRADGSTYPRQQCPTARAQRSGRTVTASDEVFWRADGTALPVSIISVPIVDEGVVTGAVVSLRDMSAQREVERQAALLVQATEREQAQRALAEQLQRALLTPPPEPDHLHLVTRYRPAAGEAQVGGDWYDAVLQPDGATVLVIGDVVGHDSGAAAAMGQLRGVVRTLAYHRDGDGPAAILTQADRTARGLGVDSLATAVVARIERSPDVPVVGTRTLRWSNAGHLPPVLLHADGSSALLDTPPDLLLGLDPETGRTDHVLDLPDHATLLLFTDGLVERRGVGLDDGLAQLRAALADLGASPLPELCDTLLARMAPHVGDDDIALIAVRTYPEDQPRPIGAGPNRLPGHRP